MGAGFEQIDVGSDQHLFCVKRGPSGTLLIGGQRATLLRSTDGGRSFTKVALKTDPNRGFLGLAAQPSGRWVLVGAGGLLLLSEDDGLTWKKQKSGTSIALSDVWASGPRIVAVGGGVDALVVRSDDGGKTWARKLHKAEGLSGLRHVFELTPGKLVALGGRSSVLVSSDGGATLEVLRALGDDEYVTSSCRPARGVLIATGPGCLLTTRDGGKTWVSKSSRGAVNRHGLCAAGGSLLSCGEGGALWQSGDEGVTWKRLATPTKAELSAIWTDTELTMVVGDGGTVLRGGAR